MDARVARALLGVGGLVLAACASADQSGGGAGDDDDAPAQLDARAATADARDASAPDARAVDASTPDARIFIDAPASRCGDGQIDPGRGEVCDDGANVGGDGCSADCTSVECTRARSYEHPVTHHCYWRETSVVSRTTAITRCAEGGGFLVRWNGNAGEGADIYPTVLGGPGGRVWIGLRKQGGGWVWDDGGAATVGADANFRSGEPSGDGDCVEWGPGHELNDVPCSVNRDFVCERAPAGV